MGRILDVINPEAVYFTETGRKAFMPEQFTDYYIKAKAASSPK